MKTFDEWFVKNRTNAPYLIGSEGHYTREPGTNKPLIWDAEAGRAKVFDDPSIESFALEGHFQVNGSEVHPAFALIKERIKDYTPEWAEQICTIPAAKIRNLAEELVKEARIGSTIQIGGVSFPYRPACISVFKGVTNHKHGHVAYYAAMTVNILLGAFDVPSGNLGISSLQYALGEDGHPQIFHQGPAIPFTFPPGRLDMAELIPHGHDVGYRLVETLADPEGHWIDYRPKACISFGTNLFSKIPGPEGPALI